MLICCLSAYIFKDFSGAKWAHTFSLCSFFFCCCFYLQSLHQIIAKQRITNICKYPFEVDSIYVFSFKFAASFEHKRHIWKRFRIKCFSGQYYLGSTLLCCWYLPVFLKFNDPIDFNHVQWHVLRIIRYTLFSFIKIDPKYGDGKIEFDKKTFYEWPDLDLI